MSAHRHRLLEDHYGVLGVDRRATQADIAQAYRRLAKQHHPDTRRGNADNGEQFRQIVAAKDVLSDPYRRAEYDRARAVAAQPGTRMADERFAWTDTAHPATRDEELAWAPPRTPPRRRRWGVAILIVVLMGVAATTAGVVLLARRAQQLESSLPTISIPSNFLTTQKDRIDQLAQARNCSELDRQLRTAQVLDERQRQHGGQGYALRAYIERARSTAQCLETETQPPPTAPT